MDRAYINTLKRWKNQEIKNGRAGSDRITTPLWAEVHSQLGQNLGVDVKTLIKNQNSVQSALGYASQRLLGAIANYHIKTGKGTVTRWTSDSEFKDTIHALREQTAEKTLNETLITSTAKHFGVTPEYIQQLTQDPTMSILYPDSASKMNNGTWHIAEHKLSGDNDSKAITKNIEELNVAAGRWETKPQTGIILPFSDEKKWCETRWVRAGGVNTVASNEQTWMFLYGSAAQQQEYDIALKYLASVAVEWMLT